jgi:hypothetical protein
VSRGWRDEHDGRRNGRSEQTSGSASVGDAADRTRFIVDKLILGDDDNRHEYYIQIVISRKAAAIVVLFLTVVVSLCEAAVRYFLT